MSKNPKIIVIGLDGATWDLIKPLADAGELPTFKKLMEEGAWGDLESTVPPVTFPAWESMFTGTNPGKLGVYGFVHVDVKKHSFNINTPSSFRGKPIWRKLNEHGFKTCMVGIPTSKVQAIDGIMVGGPFSNDNYTYPKEFKTVLKEMDYEAYPTDFIRSLRSSRLTNIGDENNNTISSRFKLAKSLVETEEPDFLALTIFVIDTIQHFFWGEPRVYEAWKHIDKELGDFISSFNDTTIILVSDHGFTRLDKTFYISKFLEEEGLLVYNGESNPKPNSIPIKCVPAQSSNPQSLERAIDWEKSKCIPLSESIYLNCPDNEKPVIKQILKNSLGQLDVIDDIVFKEEVYSGDYFNYAPDIIIKPKEGVRVLETPLKDMLISSESPQGWKGEHTPRGIFLAYGPNVKTVDTPNFNAHIYDVAPTILALFGIPPGNDMDGSILDNVIEDMQLKNSKIKENWQTEKHKIQSKIVAVRNKL